MDVAPGGGFGVGPGEGSQFDSGLVLCLGQPIGANLELVCVYFVCLFNLEHIVNLEQLFVDCLSVFGVERGGRHLVSL